MHFIETCIDKRFIKVIPKILDKDKVETKVLKIPFIENGKNALSIK